MVHRREQGEPRKLTVTPTSYVGILRLSTAQIGAFGADVSKNACCEPARLAQADDIMATLALGIS